MADQFLGEIRIVGFNFAPVGWAFCNGQLLPISQNQALFSLLGTFYGGNGTTTFGLPNFQSCAPVHQGQGPGLSPYSVGQSGGEETVTLLTSHLPVHNHALSGALYSSGIATTNAPSGGTFAVPNANPRFKTMYGDSTIAASAAATLAIPTAGGSQPHNNLMPYLTLNFIIATTGIYPARS